MSKQTKTASIDITQPKVVLTVQQKAQLELAELGYDLVQLLDKPPHYSPEILISLAISNSKFAVFSQYANGNNKWYKVVVDDPKQYFWDLRDEFSALGQVMFIYENPGCHYGYDSIHNVLRGLDDFDMKHYKFAYTEIEKLLDNICNLQTEEAAKKAAIQTINLIQNIAKADLN